MTPTMPLHDSISKIAVRGFPILLFPLLLCAPIGCHSGTYDELKSLYDTMLTSSNYNPAQRPLLNQSDVLHVNVMFELVSILEINDVFQSFRCNGLLTLLWKDERLTWDSSAYGGETRMTPAVTSVFRPRLVMVNTLDERDLFEDDHAPLLVDADGSVNWTPGSIFPASCRLDLTKYPFDEQHCEIKLISMNFNASEVLYRPADNTLGFLFYTQNGQWDIINSNISSDSVKVDQTQEFSRVVIHFDVRRKPTFLILSMILPIVFLSLLNMLVFVIPVESGEKISYGITVLLALSVFMSIMTSLLPSSSESMPLVISYIFILMTISSLTVVDAILIVRLNHMKEQEEKSQKAKRTFKTALPKIKLLRKAVSPLAAPPSVTENVDNQSKPPEMEPSPKVDDLDSLENFKPCYPILPGINEDLEANKYKLIAKHIDMVSLAVFSLVWASVTIGFLAEIAS